MHRHSYKPTMIKTYRKMNKEMNKETFVAFATQKGGVGKSTVTALVANYVHNVLGRNVAVIDCDEPTATSRSTASPDSATRKRCSSKRTTA